MTNKTRTQHVQTAFNYVFPAAAVSFSLVEILTYIYPYLDPISEHILTLTTVTLNLLFVYITKNKNV